MRKRIQIGNLDYSIDDHDLARLFAAYGFVRSVTVSSHTDSGRSTGVVFVEMGSDKEGEAAIAALNGRMYRGRILWLCRSSESSAPDAIHGEMFGPMNVSDEPAPRDKKAE